MIRSRPALRPRDRQRCCPTTRAARRRRCRRCSTSCARRDVPLALLPVRLETRFFPQPRRRQRAARPRLSGQDPHRLARDRADRRRARVGRALLGADLARRRRRAGAGARVAAARRALRRRSAPPGSRACCGPTNLERPADGAGAADAPLAPPPAFPDVAMAQPATTRRGAARRRRACCRTAGSRSPITTAPVALAATGRDIVLPLAVGPDPSPDAPPCRRGRRRARDRRRHALDGRLRRGRGARHGAAHAADAAQVRGRHRHAARVRRAAARCRRPTARAQLGRAARRAPLHRRPRVPALRHAVEQHRRASARPTAAADPGDAAQLRERDRRRPTRRCDAAVERPRARRCARPAGGGRADVLGRMASAGASTSATRAA